MRPFYFECKTDFGGVKATPDRNFYLDVNYFSGHFSDFVNSENGARILAGKEIVIEDNRIDVNIANVEELFSVSTFTEFVQKVLETHFNQEIQIPGLCTEVITDSIKVMLPTIAMRFSEVIRVYFSITVSLEPLDETSDHAIISSPYTKLKDVKGFVSALRLTSAYPEGYCLTENKLYLVKKAEKRIDLNAVYPPLIFDTFCNSVSRMIRLLNMFEKDPQKKDVFKKALSCLCLTGASIDDAESYCQMKLLCLRRLKTMKARLKKDELSEQEIAREIMAMVKENPQRYSNDKVSEAIAEYARSCASLV